MEKKFILPLEIVILEDCEQSPNFSRCEISSERSVHFSNEAWGRKACYLDLYEDILTLERLVACLGDFDCQSSKRPMTLCLLRRSRIINLGIIRAIV